MKICGNILLLYSIFTIVSKQQTRRDSTSTITLPSALVISTPYISFHLKVTLQTWNKICQRNILSF